MNLIKKNDQFNIKMILFRLLKVILVIPVSCMTVPLIIVYCIRWIITGKEFPDAPLQLLMEWEYK